MAQLKAKKSATTPKKKGAAKSPAKKATAKPGGKVAAKKAPVKAVKAVKKAGKPTVAAKKKPVKKAAPVKASKPAARKPVAKTAPKKTTKPSKAPVKKIATPVKVEKPKATPRRAVAASHRPQSAAVAVQARPAKAAAEATPKRKTPAPQTGPLTEEMLRKASESDYMSDAQLSFFQERLLQMRNEVLTRELDVKERLHQREVFADPADRASAEEEHWLDLRLRERESLLLKKIDESLRRIRDKEYGYCEKTGEAIGIARLLARPTATVCVDIKGQNERAESQYRDR